jgi:hypothetical protein
MGPWRIAFGRPIRVSGTDLRGLIIEIPLHI